MDYTIKHFLESMNQTLEWIDPKIWKSSCFLSCLVGLIVFAFSSTFSHLFGHWTWWKFLVYAAVCLLVVFGLMYLFLAVKKQKHLPKHKVQAHWSFVVLGLTSIFVYFYEKKVEEKPDAYIIISSAAFAIMSLCLSRQYRYGFEIDLLNFFCSILMTLLAKIKWWLIFVGLGISYALLFLSSWHDLPVHLRTLLPTTRAYQLSERSPDSSTPSPESNRPQEDRHLGVQVQVQVQEERASQDIQETDSERAPLLTSFDTPSENVRIKSHFMASVEKLRKNDSEIISAVSEKVNKYLKDLLNSTAGTGFPEQLNPYDITFVLDYLKSSGGAALFEFCNDVKEMMKAGLEETCRIVYTGWRKEFLQECLQRHALQDPSMKGIYFFDEQNTTNGFFQFDVPDRWEVDIMNTVEAYWSEACVSLALLLYMERVLSAYTFDGFPDCADISFAEIVRELTIPLLSFGSSFLYMTESQDKSFPFISRMDKTVNLLEDILEDNYYDIEGYNRLKTLNKL